ncbi:hypothetical protein ABZP36_010896 [Zizania latifolia]
MFLGRPSVSRISSAKKLSSRLSSFSRDSPQSSGGRSLERWLPWSSSLSSMGRSPIAGEMTPVRLDLERNRPITRPVSGSHLTPVQLRMAAGEPQPERLPHTPDLKETSAARSPACKPTAMEAAGGTGLEIATTVMVVKIVRNIGIVNEGACMDQNFLIF